MSDSVESPPLDWPALIVAARGGCDAALGQIAAQLQTYLLAVADQGLGEGLRAKLGASDAVQQSMLEAHTSISEFQGSSEGEMRVWLKRIVLHNLVDSARRYTATKSRDTKLEVPIESLAAVGHNLPSHEQSPSWQIRREEFDLELLQAVDELPSRQRRVVELRHRHGQSYQEIAAEMNASEVAVRKLWSRATEQLRTKLASNHETASNKSTPRRRPR